jgi:predicted permease
MGAICQADLEQAAWAMAGIGLQVSAARFVGGFVKLAWSAEAWNDAKTTTSFARSAALLPPLMAFQNAAIRAVLPIRSMVDSAQHTLLRRPFHTSAPD